MGLCAASLTFISSCKKSSFDDNFRDPSKVSETGIDKLYAGMIYSYRELIIPSYGNYFVTLRPTIFRYLQTIGFFNDSNTLSPGGAGIEERWTRYYNGLTQFQEIQNQYSKLSPEEQKEKEIFLLTAKIVHYDETQQTVDLHGAIPFTEAGKLNANGGDYTKSYPKYDSAEDIYTLMLNDLKAISEKLSTYSLPTTIVKNFTTQDLVNNGNLDLWKKYCNSLRLRMLTRVQASPNFSARAATELAEIINNPTKFPLILTNSDNAQVDIFNAGTDINSKGLKDALEAGGDWYANLSSKVMIDNMNSNADPRLPFIFEAGAKSNGKYIGLNQALAGADQLALAKGGTISIYNRSTFSQNQYFPGILMSATETQLLLAEYYAKNGKTALAKTAFENGVKESINLFKLIRTKSNDNTAPAAAAPTTTQITTYLDKINWDAAANKMELIATQKWIHFNIVQPCEAWSEQRRLDYPKFTFVVQNADIQKTVPVKWPLPQSEAIYNKENYEAVKAQDNANTKLFWDVN